MKALLIEDNRIISKNIRQYLTCDNWVVEVAFDGISGLDKFNNNLFDIIILDYMLPGIDGISLIKTIRLTSNIPIIMITALDDRSHTIVGLESGADDYLIKPFDLKELEIRMFNILKHAQAVSDEKIIFNDITIDLRRHSIERNHVPINLFLKEFMILEYLIRHEGTPVSRSEIIEYIWGGESLFEKDNLDVYISCIRKKLDPTIIKTIKGFGYVVELHK